MTNLQYLTPEEYKQLAKDKWLNPPKISKLLHVNKQTIYKFFKGNYTMSESNMYNLHCLLTAPFDLYLSMLRHQDNKIETIQYLSPAEYKMLAKQRKLTMSVMANHSECHPTTIYHFFKGNKKIRERTKKKLHELLTTPIEAFELNKTKAKLSYFRCNKCNRKIMDHVKDKESVTVNISSIQEENDTDQFQLVVCKSCIAKFVKKMNNVPEWILNA